MISDWRRVLDNIPSGEGQPGTQRAEVLSIIQFRLNCYDQIWDFITGYDPGEAPGAVTDYDAGHTAGYDDGAQFIIDKIRDILTGNWERSSTASDVPTVPPSPATRSTDR